MSKKVFLRECPSCFYKCNDQQQLESHVADCRFFNKKKKFVCQYCHEMFSRKYCLDRHLEKKRCKVAKGSDLPKKKLCLSASTKNPYSPEISNLEKQLAEKDREIAKLKSHPLPVEAIERFEKMEKRLDEKDKQIEESAREIAELKENPRISNQILQVVCVGSSDNYLDWGTPP
jgi:uncharacterized protein YhaN